MYVSNINVRQVFSDNDFLFLSQSTETEKQTTKCQQEHLMVISDNDSTWNEKNVSRIMDTQHTFL